MRGSLMTTLALLRLASQLLGGSPASAQIVDVPRFSLDASFSHATAPAVAVGLDGTLLFLWSEALRNDRGAFTRPFSNSGTPLTPKHRVDTSGHVYETGLSAAVDGGFVGSWHRDIPNCDVATYGQRLSALGAPLGSSFRVSDGSLTDGAVAVASLPAGPVFLWEQIPELYFRLYDPQGLPRGGQVAVGSGWLHSDIAARPDGGFVTVWWGFEPGLNLARLYDGKGTPYGDAFLVSEEFLPTSVAVTTTGDFVVAGVGAGEGSEPGAVWYRRFTSAGTPAGSPVPVHLPAPGDTYEPDIAVDAQGNVYLAWGGYNLQSSMRLPPQARAYDPADRPLGPVFDLDTWPSEGVHVARLPDGRFVNAWAALGSAFASVVSLCTPGVASCGDGVRHPQCEECDDGAANSDTVPDACRTDCRRPRCGDGVVDGASRATTASSMAPSRATTATDRAATAAAPSARASPASRVGMVSRMPRAVRAATTATP